MKPEKAEEGGSDTLGIAANSARGGNGWKSTDKRPILDDGALPRSTTALFAVACGLSVANVYYAQPLLDTLASEFSISHAAIGLVIAVSQIGYGLGLLLLVPLGDLVNRRRLIVGQTLLSTVTLLVVAWASDGTVLLVGMAVLGLFAVVTQVLVAYAATLARPADLGATVGTVTSGIIIGILLARAVSGMLADLFGWRSVYFVSAAATLMISSLLWRTLPASDARKEPISYVRLIASVFILFVELPVLRSRAVLALLAFASMTVLWTPMALRLAAAPFSLSHMEIGLFGLAGAMGAVGAARAGRIADRGFGQRQTGIALTIMLVSWLPIALLPMSLWFLILGVVALDYGLQSVHVTNQVLIHHVRPEARSRLTAGYMIFYSLGSAAGSISSTLVYAHSGWSGVCLLGGTISLVALTYWRLGVATTLRQP